jgi:hypothetical protein
MGKHLARTMTMWTEKSQAMSFENQPITGMYFLDGDAMARQRHVSWIHGEKLPLIVFPSGIPCELWESSDPDNPIVHLFGEMDLPYRGTADSAYEHAQSIAEQVGYSVFKVGQQGVRVWDDETHLLITYDNDQSHMLNVEPVITTEARPQPPLLDSESRSKLPALYSQEKLELNALAQVKFFTPDDNWTWYASEASAILDDNTYKSLQEVAADDPRIAQVIFFGLVNGYELELGFFTLEELEELRGPFGLPVERDKFFSPRTLKELQDMHDQERRGGNR